MPSGQYIHKNRILIPKQKLYFYYIIKNLSQWQVAKIFKCSPILIARKILSKDWQAYTCWGPLCGAGLAHAAYDQWGNVYACDESRSLDVFKLGNVKEKTYKEIYSSPSSLALVALSSGLSSVCDACVFHPFCGTCLVSTFGSQRNLISKLPLDGECKIRGGMVEHVFRKLIFSKDDRKVLLKWTSTKKGL
jgi:radical SAM protein with 4Fe4S-binding SPASM domain